MKGLLVVILSLPWLAAAVQPGNAMWVYKTEPLLANTESRTELFAFCAARRITDLFWSVHFGHEGTSMVIGQASELHGFIKAANAVGLRIHALTGDPSHALTRNHERVLQRVEAAVAFNNAAPGDEQLAGVHFDIEPHGLPEWKGASTKEKSALLTQFVEVNAMACSRLRALAPGMLYGADITFWFDKETTEGVPVYPVTFRGVTKDATKHLLDLADNVGIMSYRNTADGPNGIVALVTKTVAYADKAKGKAYVGVKMAHIGPPMEGFYGQTEAAMQEALKPVGKAFNGHRGYAGLAYFMYEAYRLMPSK